MPLLLLILLWMPAATAGGFERYADARPAFWRQLYPDGGETLYCGRRFGVRHGRDINIEHVFPMGWVMRAEGCHSRRQCRERSARFNRIEADLHNLYPALQPINEARSSYAFAILPGEPRRFGRCDFEIDQRRRRAEPRPAARGNIARAMFYIADRYGLELYSRQRRLLLQWHRDDPVDAEERRRNDVIERLQGNRNRFIDDPAAAERFR